MFSTNIEKAATRYLSGEKNMQEDRVGAAIRDFSAAYALNGKLIDALYMRAICLTELAQHADAVNEMEAFLEKAPTDNKYVGDANDVLTELKKYLETCRLSFAAR